MTVGERLGMVRQRISAACQRAGRSSEDITLVAITKGVAPPAILEAYRAGARHFGENRVQEAADKLLALLPDMPEATWHMVGHLQTNKVKMALGLFGIIHSVDSLKLAQSLSQRATGRLSILLQVNVSGEASKMGLPPEAVAGVAAQITALSGLELVGLMTIAPQVDDPEKVRPVFRRLRELRDSLGLRNLSMGMTDDFEVAVEEGATMVRLGRAIFGP
ncbi:MAG: YggS family pyridoxal phosphate-dependent enzyme [Chloroflexi bacterium]|nr:YggS family pyridoxal phosphate-dependent enzyme [Chloroflexota bacterium]